MNKLSDPRFSTSEIYVLKESSVSKVAKDIIEDGNQKEPFRLFDLDTAYDCVQNFREKMPRVQIYYAIKANDHDVMLKLAIALGLGFDCASPGEINRIRKHNIQPKKIIYAVTMKTPEQMLFAQESGVIYTTFDSSCELNRLKQYWPDSRLLIRVKADSDCVYKLGDKFGCDYTESVRLLEEAYRLEMNVVGVAFHVGSPCFSPQSYSQGLQFARKLFDHEAEEGRKMTLLDIGGGFFNDDSNYFKQVADIINSGLTRWFPDPEVQVIAEPGRYICETAFTLYTNIRATRTVFHCGKKTNMVYLNNGKNDLLRYVEKWHTINKFQKTNDIGQANNITEDTILWGPTMDGEDSLGPMNLVPLTVNDWLMIDYQGAYSEVFTSEYCSISKTPTLCVISENLWTILKEKPIFSSCTFEMFFGMAPILLSTLPPILGSCGNYISEVKGFKTLVIPAYVLEQHSPDDVSRAMIERGEQIQPFYIFNMDEAQRRVHYFQQMMPRVKIFYAVKANDTDMTLKLFIALGIGFVCASPGEIHKLWKLRVHSDNIIYAMPCKTAEEMAYAKQLGVKLTTFDNSYELEKIKESWPAARLLLRIRLDGVETNNITRFKFGCDFQSEATALLDEAARLGLQVVGITFHVESICYSPKSYVLGLKQARALFDYEEKNGRRMNIVDIGGGFLSDRTDRIDTVSYLINETLEDLFSDLSVKIIAEPGRYLCDSAFQLFCRIIGTRQVNRNNDIVNMIYLSNGVHGTMRFDENWHKLRKYQKSTEVEPILDQRTILWGPTGDSIDRVMKNYPIKLPKCTSDDWLVVDVHGAYTFSFSTRFSSLEIPRIRTVVSKDLWSHIKNSSAFLHSDFVVNPDISTPLPSSLPLVLPNTDIRVSSEMSMLKL